MLLHDLLGANRVRPKSSVATVAPAKAYTLRGTSWTCANKTRRLSPTFWQFDGPVWGTRKPGEYCSRVLFRRRGLTEPHWVLGQTQWVLRQTRWVRFCTQCHRKGWEELTVCELAPRNPGRNSVSPKKLTEFGVWNRTPRNRIRPVSEEQRACKGNRWPCKGNWGTRTGPFWLPNDNKMSRQ